MTKANKGVFIYAFRWVAYVIAPAILGFYYYGTTLFNGLWAEPCLLFVLLAAVCNAAMDVMSFHYDTSVFKRFNPKWWNPAVSWLNKYKGSKVENGRTLVPDALTDGWHLFKMLYIISWGLAVVTYVPNFAWYWDLLVVGVIYNCYFSLFYKNIL